MASASVHVVVVNDTAVRADRNIDAGLLEILVTGGCNLDQSRSLTAADALLLTGDADGAAADADLDEVRARLGEETGSPRGQQRCPRRP